MSTGFGQNAASEPQTDTAQLDMFICDDRTRERALAGLCGLRVGQKPIITSHVRNAVLLWIAAQAQPASARKGPFSCPVITYGHIQLGCVDLWLWGGVLAKSGTRL